MSPSDARHWATWLDGALYRSGKKARSAVDHRGEVCVAVYEIVPGRSSIRIVATLKTVEACYTVARQH